MASTSQGDLPNISTNNRSRDNPKEKRMAKMEEESLPNYLTVRCLHEHFTTCKNNNETPTTFSEQCGFFSKIAILLSQYNNHSGICLTSW